MVFEKFVLLILRDQVVFPQSIKEIYIDEPIHSQAYEAALKDTREGDDVYMLAAYVDEKCDMVNIAPENLMRVAVMCRVAGCVTTGKGSKKRSKLILEGMHRVILKRASLTKCEAGNYWSSGYHNIVTMEYLCDKWCDFAMKEVASTLARSSGGPFNLSFFVKGSMGRLADHRANAWPDDSPGTIAFKKEIICETRSVYRIFKVLDHEKYIDNKMRDKNKKDALIEGFTKLLTESKESELHAAETIDSEISQKVSRNISRQQREFYLREKLKVIRDELGEGSSRESEARKFRQMLDNGDYPEQVKKKANDELQRLEMCSSYSNEATVIRTYLDWLLNIPWNVSSEVESDLKKVQDALDSNHYGLEKVKDRIIEFLAVQKKSEKDKGTIICLVGPPGVGKTSFAQSIANSLGKKFEKISLGGVYDESELRGHRRTYVAAMPGKIVKALRDAKTNNPLILLDEVDKMSSGYHGDPIHALLEILDPKQNEKFNDHYIDEDIDLSKVMFVATANYEENIPEPLLDRMEIIYLRTYTESEKINIAKNYLIPEVLKNAGFEEKDLVFTEEALVFIIQRYTKESGVRNLKQQLEKVVRKVVKGMVVDGKEVHNIDVKKAEEYLGVVQFEITQNDDKFIPGIVNGMAYTEFGGDLLPIEVNYFLGKGNLSLTGNLRDTMKESANVALSYVRANAEAFGIQDKSIDWSNIDVNLHVPSGGVPKDGPSAGITITTALISAFSGRAVSTKIAMTGEITLRGKVLPIGGLREKVISAVRGGVEIVFYPFGNQKHLIDIPEDVRNKVEMIPVKHYSEVYDKVFSL